MIARLALSAATYSIDKPYDYLVPDSLNGLVMPGMRVFVPFGKGNRISEGIVLSLESESSVENCKEILRVADSEVLLSQEHLQLAYYMRERCFCTVYEAIRVMLPAAYWFDKSGKQRGHDKQRQMVRLLIPSEEARQLSAAKSVRAPRQAEILDLLSSFEILPLPDLLRFSAADRSTLNRLASLNLVEIINQEVYRRPVSEEIQPAPLPVLSPEQTAVFNGLRMMLEEDSPKKTSLLWGITGSGKTGVYAHLISTCLSRGQSAVLLVPEISLTPQMMALFSAWFGDEVALLHSGLSSGERFDEWKRIRRGEAHVILGTRSAVFAPADNLGLLIIDEEQEDSYRSDVRPRYHARDVAKFRAHFHSAALLLGSATPDIRSYYLADQGEYRLFRLEKRFNSMPLPDVRIIDMKKELRSGNSSSISSELKNAILQRIERQEQSILFLNRRGTNKIVSCSTCEYVYHCPHCSVPMTWHANRNRLVCHYCGYSRHVDPRCPACGSELLFSGTGTQKLEEELRMHFPGTGILRVDADTVVPVGSHRILFQRFIEERIPLMIGTQMIAKGLHFDNVTLVGVISADQSLYSNDFHAGERTFSLITQVIGRCGRGVKPGEAFIQTYTPNNEILRLAARQDYQAFFHRELEMRRIQNAPPFYDWVALSASGKNEAAVLSTLNLCGQMLKKMLMAEDAVQIWGPVPHSVLKVNDHFRYRIQICCHAGRRIRQLLSSVLVACEKERKMNKVALFVENDPGN